MTKDELKAKIDELGIIAIEDANSIEDLEIAINAVEEFNKSPQFMAIPLHIDGQTDRKLFNTKSKVLAYLVDKTNGDIQKMIEILTSTIGITYYISFFDKKDELDFYIKKYLEYQWVKYK